MHAPWRPYSLHSGGDTVGAVTRAPLAQADLGEEEVGWGWGEGVGSDTASDAEANW